MVNKEHDKAIADYDEAIRLDTTNAHIYTARGWAWQNKNDFAKALADYHEAIRLNSDDAVAVHNRNWLLATFRNGNRREDEKTSGDPQHNCRSRNIGTCKSISRALIAFHIRCWQLALAPVLGIFWLFITTLPWGHPFIYFLVPMLVALCLRVIHGWYAYGQWGFSFWPWRLSRRVVGFSTMASDRVSLLFPAGLEEMLDLQDFIRCSESDLDDLSERFANRLRRRLTVVLIPSHQDLTEDFGRPMGGTALTHANAVLLAADCPLREGLRHELTHLFAVRWNGYAPPLVQEGLAVWLQGTTPGQTVTPEVMDQALSFGTDPTQMLDSRYFFDLHRMNVSYTLAGEFTGFLIRHFGWDHYRGFYGKVSRLTFRSLFQRHFGMSFEEAWWRCHDESVERARLRLALKENRSCSQP